MKKEIFFLHILSIILLGCKDTVDNKESSSLLFRPRTTTYIWAVPGIRISQEYGGITYYDYYTIENNSNLSYKDFIISISLANKSIDSLIMSKNPNYEFINFTSIPEFTTTGIPSLEKEITLNFKKNTTSKTSSKVKSYESANIIDMEYRVDGIINLTISSLDVPLFGKAAGTSLNEYFDIIRYAPDFIASYESKSLLYGFYDTDKPTSIDEWLSLKPLAQPNMFIRLNTAPDNLPLTTRFKVEVETTTGLLISDTTKVVTLTN